MSSSVCLPEHKSDVVVETYYESYRRIVKHRWVRVAAFGAAVTFTSCLYAGWQQFSLLLIKGGKYGWLCDASDVSMTEGGVMACADQERAVGTLFPLAAAVELLGAVFAGLALDHCGPRSTAIVGEILGVISILLMMFSSSRFNLLQASMITTGIAINLVAFPSLILEDYFPAAAATTAAFVVACQSLACLIAPVLWVLWQSFPRWTFNGIWTVYLIICWIPVAIFYIVCLPAKREARDLLPPSPVVMPQNAPQNTTTIANTTTSNIHPPTPGGQSTEASGIAVSNIFNEEEEIESSSNIHIPRSYGVIAFGKACASPEFLTFNLINMVLMLQTAYYQVIVRSQSGAPISDFVGWSMPTQAIWGLLLGRAVDHVKTPAMIVTLLIGYGLTYLLIMAGRSSVQYVTASLFIVVCSYAYTVKYSYIQETFPPSFYGTLVGISGALSGVSVLLTNVLTSTMSVHFWCLMLAGASLMSMPFTTYLWWAAATRRARLEQEKKGEELSAPLLATLGGSPRSFHYHRPPSVVFLHA